MPKSKNTTKRTRKQRFVIIRGTNSGAFAGKLISQEGQHVKLKDSRRLWYWSGAASLSELAQRGTSRPEACKFPAAVDHHEILDTIEILDMTDAAIVSIGSVKPWTV